MGQASDYSTIIVYTSFATTTCRTQWNCENEGISEKLFLVAGDGQTNRSDGFKLLIMPQGKEQSSTSSSSPLGVSTKAHNAERDCSMSAGETDATQRTSG